MSVSLAAAGTYLSVRQAQRAPLSAGPSADTERELLLLQTWAVVAVNCLPVVVLLAGMWLLSRVVRREVALAELKANFVADVSHELKTPLALIRLFAETLQSGRVLTPEKKHEYYSVIVRESTRLTNLINNILDFAKIEAGRKEYTLKATDVGKVVRETYETYRPQLEHEGFEHHLVVANDLPQVDADPDAIAQVVVNLLNNAIKYSRDDRFVAIEVQRDTRRGRRGVLLCVHDRGIGIRPEDRAHLTEGFFRAGDPRVRERGGTGLGLALVEQIVAAHHGSLDIETRLVKGSTFRVFLPASGAQPSLPDGASIGLQGAAQPSRSQGGTTPQPSPLPGGTTGGSSAAPPRSS